MNDDSSKASMTRTGHWMQFTFGGNEYGWKDCMNDVARGEESAKELWARFLIFEAAKRLTS